MEIATMILIAVILTGSMLILIAAGVLGFIAAQGFIEEIKNEKRHSKN